MTSKPQENPSVYCLIYVTWETGLLLSRWLLVFLAYLIDEVLFMFSTMGRVVTGE